MYNSIRMPPNKGAGAVSSSPKTTPARHRFKKAFQLGMKISRVLRILITCGLLHLNVLQTTPQQLKISITLESKPLDNIIVEMIKLSGHPLPHNLKLFKVSDTITIDLNYVVIEDLLHQYEPRPQHILLLQQETGLDA